MQASVLKIIPKYSRHLQRPASFYGSASFGELPIPNEPIQPEDIYETNNLDLLLYLLRRMQSVGVANRPPFDALKVNNIGPVSICNVTNVNGSAVLNNVTVVGLGKYNFDFLQLRYKNLSIENAKLLDFHVQYPALEFSGNAIVDYLLEGSDFLYDISFSGSASKITIAATFGLEQEYYRGLFYYQIKSYFNLIYLDSYTLSVKPHRALPRSRVSIDDLTASILSELIRNEINAALWHYTADQVDAFLNEPVIEPVNPTTKPTTTSSSKPTTSTTKPTTSATSEPSPSPKPSLHDVLYNITAKSKQGILPNELPITVKDIKQRRNLLEFIVMLLRVAKTGIRDVPPFEPCNVENVTISVNTSQYLASVTFANVSIVGLENVFMQVLDVFNTDNYTHPEPKLLEFLMIYEKLSFSSAVKMDIYDRKNLYLLNEASLDIKAKAENVASNGSLSFALRPKQNPNGVSPLKEEIEAFSIFTFIDKLEWSAYNLRGIEFNILPNLMVPFLKYGPDEISEALMLQSRDVVNEILLKIDPSQIEAYLG